MARKKIDPALESLALADVLTPVDVPKQVEFARATLVQSLRPGDRLVEGKKCRDVIKIEDPCCRTKVHVRTDNGTACYDALAEVYVA